MEKELKKENTFGVVESVKTASDVYSPVSGVVVDTNQDLEDAPEKVSSVIDIRRRGACYDTPCSLKNHRFRCTSAHICRGMSHNRATSHRAAARSDSVICEQHA